MTLLHPVSNSRYLREDLTEVAVEASQQIQDNTQIPPQKISLSPVAFTRSLTPEQLTTVSVAFKDNIRKRTSPQKKHALSVMENDEVL